MSVADYEKLLMEQDGVCAVCKSPVSHNKRSIRLHVDHCHITGTIRGLLCHRCNTGIGLFRDDLNLLNNAIVYLSKSEKTNETQ